MTGIFDLPGLTPPGPDPQFPGAHLTPSPRDPGDRRPWPHSLQATPQDIPHAPSHAPSHVGVPEATPAPWSLAAPRTSFLPQTLHATLVAADIAAYGSPERDDDAERYLRREMYTLLADAFTMSELPWPDCYTEDRGDGVLVVAPPHAPLPGFLDPLAHHTAALLRRTNSLANPVGRMRLRLAVHAGPVHRDLHGLVGRPITHLFRLLEAPAYKKAFAQAADADTALVVSEEVYRNATTISRLINRAAYQPLRITCKETRATARLWLPPNWC